MSVEMLKLTGDSVVADEIELSTLNSVLGMHSPTGRWSTYNTPMDGVRRASAHAIVFQAREGSPELNCCSVNSPRGFGMISDWAVMRDEEGLILNYYGPSAMTDRTRPDWSIRSRSPRRPTTRSRDRSSCASTRHKRPRLPSSCASPTGRTETSVSLNGAPVSGVEAGAYLSLERTWQAGDTIHSTWTCPCTPGPASASARA